MTFIEDREAPFIKLEPGESLFRVSTGNPLKANYIIRPDFFSGEEYDRDFTLQCILAAKKKYGEDCSVDAIEPIQNDVLNKYFITAYLTRTVAGKGMQCWTCQYSSSILISDWEDFFVHEGSFEKDWEEAVAATKQYLRDSNGTQELEAYLEACFLDWDGAHSIRHIVIEGSKL